MRVLLIHSDYLKYKTKNKTKIAEEIDDSKQEGAFEDSLVVFTAVEKEDEKNEEKVVKNFIEEVKSVHSDIKSETIVLYPYAHLSSSLSSPQIAIKILVNAEKALKEEGFNVYRVPFGWYKSFELSCKGHPLSELSRNISGNESEKSENDDEDKQDLKHDPKFLIYDNGKLIAPDEYTYNNKNLKRFIEYELGESSKTETTDPPHVKLMREKELCDYESASDVGNLKWYPKGRLVRDLLSDYVYNLVVENGAMPIETPVMYDLENKAISEHAGKFGERQYKIHTKKELMLRFACCFGAFRVLGESFLTWKNLPARVYELSTYSFRYEKRGEVVGLKRLRAFTMPDWHTACVDMNQTLEEFEKQTDVCIQTGIDLNVDYEVILRATEEFYKENKVWMDKIAEKIAKPVIFEIIPERKHYWVCKIDFAAIDALGRPIENPTVQIDVESGKRFDISYLGEDEKEHHPVIIHCSPTGSIERVICSLLEKTAIELNEKPPMLPVWLSPIQLRIIPINDSHLEYSNNLAEELSQNNIRVDVDDREDRLGKKIRNAAKEWIPYTVVIGDNEIENNIFSVSIRSTKQKEDLTKEELVEKINAKCKNLPFRKLPLPKKLSTRINFK
ncbi:threonine--tRNA ligase [Methanobrevibacter filiformis]|uniref:Threonine--tRNA ligase n=1 Tax=Methanobrevibacter filiformis TaxID=55758 RepID=A0A166AUJ9_9EURY|nr:threonine--tRNA ligase [Methanobrevibacter filiformis]KZX12489.1 threonine--tRNA ligase [Methanobrevibacter filiformis]